MRDSRSKCPEKGARLARARVLRAFGGMSGQLPCPRTSTPHRPVTDPSTNTPQPLETPSAPKCAGPTAPARMPWARGAVASPSAFLLSPHSTTRGGGGRVT